MQGHEESGIREHDKELAAELADRDDVQLEGAELLQLAAIYAALPEDRRGQWFARLGSEGVSSQLLDRIVERAGKMIRFPDRRSGERLREEHESDRHQNAMRAADRRRRSSDVTFPDPAGAGATTE